MVTIIDYGTGNLGSIKNMLKKIGVTAMISGRVDDIAAASRLILPGVGAFDNGMKKLEQMGLIDVLNRKALEEKIPVLGICLGMQLLTRRSEEGTQPGLGWIDAETRRFSFPEGLQDDKGRRYKIPHMGWNSLSITATHPLLEGLDKDNRFYFVHSYYVVVNQPETILAQTHYGFDFVSVMAYRNILGAQFHPEKSHKFGMKLLNNFISRFHPETEGEISHA